jgi:uncharacterized protein with PIN domain
MGKVAGPGRRRACTACNGPLSPVSKADVEQLLPGGTRRTYQVFSRCRDLRPYLLARRAQQAP